MGDLLALTQLERLEPRKLLGRKEKRESVRKLAVDPTVTTVRDVVRKLKLSRARTERDFES